MKEIVKIAMALTISCLVAGSVMGGVFMVTAEAKKRNQQQNRQETMFELIAPELPGRSDRAAENLSLHSIYRYIIQDNDRTDLGYLAPVEQEAGVVYEMWVLDLEGNLIDRRRLGLSPETAMEKPDRDAAVTAALGPGQQARYADTMIIAAANGERIAYLLPGEFSGFKTFIHVMAALDADFNLLGLEIMDHEEDPGLGGEIEKPYFKNQFKGKSLEQLRDLDVIKEPLPDDYRHFLEKTAAREDLVRIGKAYQDEDIHAIAGATISSRCVTDGLKRMVKKSVYRIKILDRVISKNHIPAAM